MWIYMEINALYFVGSQHRASENWNQGQAADP